MTYKEEQRRRNYIDRFMKMQYPGVRYKLTLCHGYYLFEYERGQYCVLLKVSRELRRYVLIGYAIEFRGRDKWTRLNRYLIIRYIERRFSVKFSHYIDGQWGPYYFFYGKIRVSTINEFVWNYFDEIWVCREHMTSMGK